MRRNPGLYGKIVLIAQFATRALLDELHTTPKPGLVDRRNSGAHADLCVDRLETSAYALEDTFARIACSARHAPASLALREEIGDLGRLGERVMLAATGGSNTHRGALWALGLLTAASASTGSRDPHTIARRAAELARLPDRFARPSASHGYVAMRRYGARGARGEAAAGFPHVVDIALPALRSGVPGRDVFLRVLASLDDTCLLHRGGVAALAAARRGARKIVTVGSETAEGGRALAELERALLSRNASPGGCADVLAAAYFLDAFAR